ncbi:hypothetical protein FNF27_00274 [Cafeteria roenbergensis]|uniref:EamA domain-containing protein n=1 Tax=Cafeteria roenbergensis TaxID=33653 RepID=A0A5A8EKL4_CAFRO|nr:hypothetical protein FNF27_00274 [Cafeteria roenbergensis]
MKTYFHYFLALGMLITGSVNTLSTKWADQQCAVGAYGDHKHLFVHPFVQSAGMFLGEALCLVAFLLLIWRAAATKTPLDRAKPFNRLLLAIPAAHDMCATSVMYIGLALTTASAFQMLRGSVVIFTALFSVIFLKRKQYLFHWIGVVLVALGCVCVGVAGLVSTNKAQQDDYPNMTIGNIIIIVAQIIVASQMVIEERLVSGFDIPALEVVGFEGLWGMILLSLALIAMFYIPKPAVFCPTVEGNCGAKCNMDHFEDPIDAFAQMGNNVIIPIATLGNVLSIAGFNFFGISVTKHLNAATRMVLDSVRTIVIWAVSVAVGWDVIHLDDPGFWTQLAGFFILLLGTVVYNSIVRIPYVWYPEEDAATKSTAINAGGMGDEMEGGLLEGDALAGEPVGAESPAFGLAGQSAFANTPSGVMGRASLIKKR